MHDIEFEHIIEKRHLEDFCQRNADAKIIGFDTEFVSENRYRPQLCLLQIATPDSLAIVDTIAINDISPFWQLICEQVETTVVHAAREEFLFCLREYGKRPRGLVDLQLAAAFVGHEFPAAYSSLAQKILNKRLGKGETRTDWRMRPLSKKQIHYALQDVEFLIPMHTELIGELKRLGRMDWYWQEIDAWQANLERTEREPQWQRLPGLTRLSRRDLAVVRELFLWRDAAAKTKERAPRRVLPDDLLIEIAKRGESQTNKLTAIRGLTQRVNARSLPDIGAVVARARALPESQWPAKVNSAPSPSVGILGQILTASLNLLCHEKNIAPGLVATAQEIKNLAAWKMGVSDEPSEPEILSGWRGPFVNELFDDVLKGRVVLRVTDPNSANPVRLEKWPEQD
ncbi:MAG: HRDC domain-containing protein [Pirellulaceae bacterium]